MPPGAAEWVVAVFELHRCPDPAVAGTAAVADTAAVVMAVATAAAVWASLS